MVRAKLWHEDMVARFPEGTFEQIKAVLREREERTDFVREAVARELKRRSAKKEFEAMTALYRHYDKPLDDEIVVGTLPRTSWSSCTN